MTTAAVGTICSVVFSFLGFLVAYLTLQKKNKDANLLDGEKQGSMMLTLKYIKETCDTLSRQTDNLRDEVAKLNSKVAVLEERSNR